MVFGKSFIVLDSVDSTNNYAANMLKTSDVAHGTVVMAYFQTNGRGQRGTSWQSNRGENLMMSLILKPLNLAASEQFILSQVICLGLLNYLRTETGIPATIKWPNDMLINGNKLAGVLIENSLRGNVVEHSIVGIGMNLNQNDFPAGVPAISIREITGKQYECGAVAKGLLPYLQAEYERINDAAGIKKRYLQHLLGYRKLLWYQKDGDRFQAEITGLGLHGELVLRCADGAELICGFKEVELLRENFG